jgi:hypothetical protein
LPANIISTCIQRNAGPDSTSINKNLASREGEAEGKNNLFVLFSGMGLKSSASLNN